MHFRLLIDGKQIWCSIQKLFRFYSQAPPDHLMLLEGVFMSMKQQFYFQIAVFAYLLH